MTTAYKIKDIVYEKGPFWVLADPQLKAWKIFKQDFTVHHSEKVATVGFSFGMERVHAEIDRRMGGL